jgi:hypothetical protein
MIAVAFAAIVMWSLPFGLKVEGRRTTGAVIMIKLGKWCMMD